MEYIEFRWLECKPKRCRDNISGEITTRQHGKVLQYRNGNLYDWVNVPTVTMNYDEFENESNYGT